jgi:hypothetical protein
MPDSGLIALAEYLRTGVFWSPLGAALMLHPLSSDLSRMALPLVVVPLLSYLAGKAQSKKEGKDQFEAVKSRRKKDGSQTVYVRTKAKRSK